MVQGQVRHALYRDRVKRYQMDKDVVQSIKSWFKKIEEEGGKTMLNVNVHSTGFAFGWCSSFQLKVRRFMLKTKKDELSLLIIWMRKLLDLSFVVS
jgi:hypothetical protein